MKTIDKNEFYRNVSQFLQSKGIELTDGSFSGHIRRGCGLLTDAINATQRTVTRAKEEVDKKLLRLRQCIHEATAPSQPPPAAPSASKPSPAKGSAGPAKKKKKKPGKATARRSPSSASK